MQITHEEAHKLIQFNSDEALSAREKIALSAHLKDCIECRAYADDIREVESILLPAMKRQWDLQPIPLSIGAIRAKRNSKLQMNIILATRMTAIGVVFLAFIFSVWQFSVSGGGESKPLSVSVLPVPTPSTQSTSTKITFRNCDLTLYIVQENDTLESLADQFAVSQEEITAINNMKTETVSTAMKLMIPICNFTPTGTVNPTVLATTYTPPISLTTSTPDG
ncbi:MAG: LysM peptidoglycan-binding domain-containing protein [Chloroflexi bacterium]|nr:MAG: LysM peptidoglycan-binding domain-containing protein [Chloroflexota bacterium]